MPEAVQSKQRSPADVPMGKPLRPGDMAILRAWKGTLLLSATGRRKTPEIRIGAGPNMLRCTHRQTPHERHPRQHSGEARMLLSPARESTRVIILQHDSPDPVQRRMAQRRMSTRATQG